MCPYAPKYFQDSEIIRKEILEVCSKEELDVINS